MLGVDAMNASPWDGSSRRGLRIGLALILAFDAVVAASAITNAVPGSESVRMAPWLLAFARRPELVLAVVAIVVGALLSFALDRRSMTAGLVAFVGLGLLSTALTAVQGAASRNFYVGGAALLGWLCGEALELRRARSGAPVARSSLAEAGAAGTFAATYFCASVSKLLEGGGSWLSPGTLQSLVLAHAPVSGDSLASSYSRLVASSPGLASAFAAATLTIQVLAPAWLLGPRLRMAWGMLFVGFHINVFVLTGIPYVESCYIAALFSFPWARIVGRLRGLGARARTPELVESVPGTALLAVPAALVALGLAARLIPEELRPRGDPFTRWRPTATDDSSERRRFGPLGTGDRLAGDWVVDSIRVDRDQVRIRLKRSERELQLVISPEPGERAPFAPEGISLYYAKTDLPIAEFQDAGRDLSTRLERSAGSKPVRDAVRLWLNER
jgi:hypothetical protein